MPEPAPEIVVVGSVNMDLVVRVERLPRPGETVLGSDYASHPGGKGANQAVAAARLGAGVCFVGRFGSDAFGTELRRALKADGVTIAPLAPKDGPSGVAFIEVDAGGQNRIVVAPGANAQLSEADLAKDDWRGVKLVMLQLEVPLATVLAAAGKARQVGAVVMLNLAPAMPLDAEQLADVTLLLVNEHEAARLLGARAAAVVSAPQEAAQRLCALVPAAVITLGGAGAAWAVREGVSLGPAAPLDQAARSGTAAARTWRSGLEAAFAVEVEDTTAAGDAFAGALAAFLVGRSPISQADAALGGGAGAGARVLDQADTLAAAVRFANAAGALATSRRGAQPSLPVLEEVAELLRSRR